MLENCSRAGRLDQRILAIISAQRLVRQKLRIFMFVSCMV